MRFRTRLHFAGLLVWCQSTALLGQSIEARVSRLYDATHWTTYRLGIGHPLTGTFGIELHGEVIRPGQGGNGGFAGVGTDLTLFRGARDGPYLVAGLGAGLGSETADSYSDTWGSWSAGLGYDAFPVSFLSLGLEGRWRELSLGARSGFELGLGFRIHLGDRGSGSPPPASARPPTSLSGDQPMPQPPGPTSNPHTLADSIIATATRAMGRPYRYGGTGQDGSGFDCSGLIQFAFGEHGIVLPRRSVDQAREGKKVDRKLASLRPADLLTFSNQGGPITHVGLYIGNGEFIHSATRGVQVSVLSPDDPYGRWWYQRWVGVRRIVP